MPPLQNGGRMPSFDWLERRKEYGMFFVRLIVGFHLVYGVVDNVFSWEHMLKFRDFLAANGTPMPLLAAVVSAYAMYICGLMYLFGAAIRYASIVMIINFIAALLIAHRVGGYPPAALALVMLFSSIAFLFHGAGRPSVDAWLASRAHRRNAPALNGRGAAETRAAGAR